jgi:hypothetical protein
MSRNDMLMGYAYTDASGNALIEFTEPITGEEPLDLVVTAYNKIPYMTQITIITNNPPEKPATPTGPASGKPGTSYLYTTSTTDPDGDQVFYMWDWGDGNFSDWIGPFNSGASATATYSWTEQGTYSIKVKAKDTFGDESVWSDPLPITMPLDLPSQQQSMNFILFRYLKI